jgi:hypothetical protein
MKAKVSKLVLVRAYLGAKRRMRRRGLPLSVHYRRKFEGLNPDGWREFLTIDKAEMLANFDSLNTVGIRLGDALKVAHRGEQSRDFSAQLGDVTVGLSSGTSGNAGVFLADPRERARWAGNVLAKVLPHSLLRLERIVPMPARKALQKRRRVPATRTPVVSALIKTKRRSLE